MLRLFVRLRRIATFRHVAVIAHCVRKVTHFASRTESFGLKTTASCHMLPQNFVTTIKSGTCTPFVNSSSILHRVSRSLSTLQLESTAEVQFVESTWQTALDLDLMTALDGGRRSYETIVNDKYQ